MKTIQASYYSPLPTIEVNDARTTEVNQFQYNLTEMGPCEKKLTGVVNITVRMSVDSTAVKYRLELMAHLFSGTSRPSSTVIPTWP